MYVVTETAALETCVLQIGVHLSAVVSCQA
jgi:hypothetical protein